MRRLTICAGMCGIFVMTCLATLHAADLPTSRGTIRRIKVIADRAPDCSTLKSIVESVTKDCKSNDEKAIALYNFMQLSHYHQGYPSEKEGLGALREINVYGWSLCGGLHTVEAALWREMGWPWRYVGWSDPGHTTVEAFYDGRWHYLDVFLRYYTWMPLATAPGGRTIAGEEDIRANPALVTEGLEFDKNREVYYHRGNKFEIINAKANWRAPSFLSCGDTPGGILSGIRSSSRAGSPTGWATIQFDSPGYSTDVNLAVGSSLTLTWDATEGAHWWNGRQHVPGHGCGDRDYRNCPSIGPILEPYAQAGGKRRSFSNGTSRVASDFSKTARLQDFVAHDNVKWSAGSLVPVDFSRPGSITLQLQSPYVMSRASGRADGADVAEISFDHGQSFKPIKLENFSEEVGGHYDCQIKLSFKTILRSYDVEAIVQCNRGALPYLSPGKNSIAVEIADPKELEDSRLVVTYAYYPGFRSKTYEALADAGAEVARAHGAAWSKELHVVQKVFSAQDFPAKFEIDIPTPPGKLPVYPRMVYLRREIVAAGSQPLPLAPNAVTPQPAAPESLQTLPNPFTIGITLALVKPAAPTADAVRAAVTKALPLLVRGGQGALEKRKQCFTCHNTGLTVQALTTARQHGFPIDEEHLQTLLKHTADFLGRNKDDYLQGKGQGGQIDTAGYALWTLNNGGWKPDATTAAVAEYLLQFQQDRDYWRPQSRRPPTEQSYFTSSFLALRGLKVYGTKEQSDRIEARYTRVRQWLISTAATDTEDRVFRLRALHLAAAPDEEIQKAVQELLQAQREDGGWSQLPDLTSDAYATGSALVALQQSGALAVESPAYKKGLAYLISTQLEDGSWHVKTRSKPIQAFFESGYPHDNDQFISIAAAGWSTTALALALPQLQPDESKPKDPK
ncbi:MAG: hypothetical protein JWM11_6530 [Planctomycetaceae bacterium]|nr:hypothetical protein [Planctomycetaceae bacterium]